MCGFTGYFDPSCEHDESVIRKMSNQISNRGPDAYGSYINNDIGISIGHRRLSIQDLSSNGSQPFISNDKRYSLVFNGEIYNHLELRKLLNLKISNKKWKSTSDTETLLHTIEFFGLEDSLKLLEGMFSFALLDTWQKQIILCRDRFGEKPLYYGLNNGVFFFGSQLKSFKLHPKWNPNISSDGLNEYFLKGFIGGNHSIYKGIYKLKPSQFIKIELKKINLLDTKNYSKKTNINLDLDIYNQNSLLFELDKRIDSIVNSRILSDRKIGSFLSGGIDSTLITYYLQRQFSHPIDTFTIGFKDKEFDESLSASRIANYLGTNHNEAVFSKNHLLNLISKLPNIWDEPFSDPSQLPTLLLSEIATKKVKVAFSGDGGDELFCGYSRYNSGYNAYQLINKSPKFIKSFYKSIASIVRSDKSVGLLKILPDSIRPNSIVDRVQKLEKFLNFTDEKDFYSELTKIFSEEDALLVNSRLEAKKSLVFSKDYSDYREYMMKRDIIEYLPDDILTKVDRSSMHHGLEVRVPFLDYEFANWAQSIPIKLKRYDGKGKWPLRKLLSKKIPNHLFIKPKKGFGIPLSNIINNDLRDLVHEKLSKEKIINQGIFNNCYVQEIIKRNYSGEEKFHNQIWTLLIFQLWFDDNF